MKSKDQLLFEQAYDLVMESLSNPYEYIKSPDLEQSEDEEHYDFYSDPEDPSSFYRVDLMYEEAYSSAIISFAYHSKDHVGGTQEMTNTGDAFRVLATVKEIVFEYLNRHLEKIEEITFSAKANERGRVTLYKRLAQMLVQHLGEEWEFSSHMSKQDGTPREVFTIERT